MKYTKAIKSSMKEKVNLVNFENLENNAKECGDEIWTKLNGQIIHWLAYKQLDENKFIIVYDKVINDAESKDFYNECDKYEDIGVLELLPGDDTYGKLSASKKVIAETYKDIGWTIEKNNDGYIVRNEKGYIMHTPFKTEEEAEKYVNVPVKSNNVKVNNYYPIFDGRKRVSKKVKAELDDNYKKELEQEAQEIIKNFKPYVIKWEKSENGGSVLIGDKNSDFQAWVDVWISGNDVGTDWNQYITYTNDPKEYRDLQVRNDTETVFDLATSEAIYCLEQNNIIGQDEAARWFMVRNNKKHSSLKRKAFKITGETNLWKFDAWSGAKETKKYILEAHKGDEFDALIEELYPDGIDETKLNDLLWFESEWLYETLGINPYEDNDEESEDNE